MALLAGALVVVAGWSRRWVADDGLIAVRVAEQIAAGHGPVINSGERVEVSTSVLWPWLLAALAWLPIELTWVSVVLGIFCSAVAVYVGYMATARLRAPGEAAWPFAVLIVVAVPAFWTFFSSGLETGLVFLWLAVSWRALVASVEARHASVKALLLWGMGPLVRPELVLVTLATVAAVVTVTAERGQVVRHTLRASVALLPALVYEVFRAGYFGVLVPNPAITKEAGSANWRQGLWYLADLLLAYHLWVPLLLLVVASVLRGRRQQGSGAWVATATFVIPGACMGLYIVRTGGDFMHARLLLPAVFCVALPFFAARRPSGLVGSVAFVVLLCWAMGSSTVFRPPYSGTQTMHQIVDERSQLKALRQGGRVITHGDLAQANEDMWAAARLAEELPGASYVPYDGWNDGRFVTLAARGSNGVLAAHALGVTSTVAHTHRLYAHDLLGLADPVTAHHRLDERGRPGHEKWLPDAWFLARYVSPDAEMPPSVDPGDVVAARHALGCPGLKKLRNSYSGELTPSLFLSNLVGSLERTLFRFDASPKDAVTELC
jgi:arabinofuranosyltransferase